MRAARIAVFCMPGDGHFNLLRPVITDLARLGLEVHVFAPRRYFREIERAGATAVDLFERRPMDVADNESVPIPCRNVSFAAAYVEDIVSELRALDPVLVIYETFAVIGWLAARQLGLPYVNVQAGHNLYPAVYLPILAKDPRVAVSECCWRAVEVLRDRYGVTDASPFSYVTGQSPWLNIYCEPPQFLDEAACKAFEPLAFYGCIPSPPATPSPGTVPACFREKSAGPKLYVCFGTVAPGYFAEPALGVFKAVCDFVDERSDMQALISLGGASIGNDVLRQFKRPNVEIVDYAYQCAVLDEADIFLTHHGLNSTHEAIFRLRPMISYPFFGDQPALAKKCRELGLAVPLGRSTRGTVDAGDLRTAIETVEADKASIDEKLELARSWELDVIGGRPAVLRSVLDLAL